MASGLDEEVIAQKMKEMGIDTSDPDKGALLQATMAKLGKILTAKSTSEAILEDLHPKVCVHTYIRIRKKKSKRSFLGSFLPFPFFLSSVS